ITQNVWWHQSNITTINALNDTGEAIEPVQNIIPIPCFRRYPIKNLYCIENPIPIPEPGRYLE
ncbi:MAG: hypothetical protein ACE5KD_00965, partial [Candidatus Bathyarchaeia archaeon]